MRAHFAVECANAIVVASFGCLASYPVTLFIFWMRAVERDDWTFRYPLIGASIPFALSVAMIVIAFAQ